MAEQTEIWRAAGLLVDQAGGEAAAIAERRIVELERQGDQVGAATWRQIREAVEELAGSMVGG